MYLCTRASISVRYVMSIENFIFCKNILPGRSTICMSNKFSSYGRQISLWLAELHTLATIAAITSIRSLAVLPKMRPSL